MSFLKRTVKSAQGFTLVEMTVVIAIIAVLAALALPAVTGIATSTRGTSKIGDQKEVEQAVTRFEDANPGTFPSTATPSSATVAVDGDGDGFIDIIVDSIAGDTASGVTPSSDVTCEETSSLAAALAICFGEITFSDLVPDFLTSPPQHDGELIFASGGASSTSGTGVADNDIATPELTIANCNLAGDTCRFYLTEYTEDLTAALQVWNVNSNNGVFSFKEDALYSK